MHRLLQAFTNRVRTKWVRYHSNEKRQKHPPTFLSAKSWSYRYDLCDIYMNMAAYENSWAQGWIAKAVVRLSVALNMAFIRP